jgi:hypothetical protein
LKPTKEQIKEHHGAALKRCVDLFSQLGEKEWAKKASDHWTAKEHLAHMAVVQETETLVEMRQALAGEPLRISGIDKREDVRSFRNRGMEGARDLPVSELARRIEVAYNEQARILDGLTEGDLDKPAKSPTWGYEGTVRDLYSASYQFLARQYQEIRRAAKTKPPHWIAAGTVEEAKYFLDRTFHYMPLILWSERAADMNVTYRFIMEGASGGEWSVRIADGKATSTDGAPDSFDAEIRTTPALWMDLTMGHLSPPIAIMTRKVKLGGNPALALKLSGLFGEDA